MHTVLVPGLLCSARLYERVLPAVWAQGSVGIADTRRDATLPAMARRLLETAPPAFALVGLSMGGYVALEVLRQAPERVLALGLLSTSARADTPEQTAARREQQALVAAGRFEELVELALPITLGPEAIEDPALRGVVTGMAHEVGPDVFRAQQDAIAARPDARDLLPAVTVPAAVVHGTADALIPAEVAEETAGLLPDAALTLVEGCGHGSALERPAEVGAALTALLDRAA